MLAPAGAEEGCGVIRVVTCVDGNVVDLLHGMPPRLAPFDLYQVKQLLLVFKDQIVVAEEDSPASGQ